METKAPIIQWVNGSRINKCWREIELRTCVDSVIFLFIVNRRYRSWRWFAQWDMMYVKSMLSKRRTNKCETIQTSHLSTSFSDVSNIPRTKLILKLFKVFFLFLYREDIFWRNLLCCWPSKRSDVKQSLTDIESPLSFNKNCSRKLSLSLDLFAKWVNCSEFAACLFFQVWWRFSTRFSFDYVII